MGITRKSHSSATFILFFYSPIDLFVHILLTIKRGRHSRDRMVVGYLTTYAISAYHHQHCEYESPSGEV